MSTFPQTASFTGFNTPSRIESDIADLAHEGTIPPELNGAFYRVQPDPQFPPRLGDDISFNGDGMISRFHFHESRCDFRQRWARTEKWKLENAAGKGLLPAPPREWIMHQWLIASGSGSLDGLKLVDAPEPVPAAAVGFNGEIALSGVLTRDSDTNPEG